MIIGEIAQYLSNLGVGIFNTDPVVGGGNIFLYDLPDKPSIAIAIYSAPGMPPSQKLNIKEPGVQIIVRGIDQQATFALAQSVFDALHATPVDSFVSGGTRIIMCQARQSEPQFLERDENRNYWFSLNFQLVLGG